MTAAFIYQHRVTYADCTLGNHIYHARYLDLLEAARGALFRHLGFSFLQFQNQELIFPVLESHLYYQSPARYDDLIDIHLWPTLAHGPRLNFAYQITRAADTLILKAETLHVCTNLQDKPKRLPKELITALEPLLRTA